MTILIGDITKADREGYLRGLQFALDSLKTVDETAPGNPAAMARRGTSLPPESSGVRFLVIHSMRERLQAEIDNVIGGHES